MLSDFDPLPMPDIDTDAEMEDAYDRFGLDDPRDDLGAIATIPPPDQTSGPGPDYGEIRIDLGPFGSFDIPEPKIPMPPKPPKMPKPPKWWPDWAPKPPKPPWEWSDSAGAGPFWVTQHRTLSDYLFSDDTFNDDLGAIATLPVDHQPPPGFLNSGSGSGSGFWSSIGDLVTGVVKGITPAVTSTATTSAKVAEKSANDEIVRALADGSRARSRGGGVSSTVGNAVMLAGVGVGAWFLWKKFGKRLMR